MKSVKQQVVDLIEVGFLDRGLIHDKTLMEVSIDGTPYAISLICAPITFDNVYPARVRLSVTIDGRTSQACGDTVSGAFRALAHSLVAQRSEVQRISNQLSRLPQVDGL